MIYLTKGQPLFENPGLVVYDQTGYYEDGASVICAMVYAPEEPVCRYEAKFIAYGGMVYNITDSEKLMEEVIKIDPQSLFGKDSQQIALDKKIEEIVPKESGEITSEPPVEESVSASTLETPPTPPASEINTSTTTPAVDTNTSTTTPSSIDTNTSTTTPSVIETPTSTTTPETAPFIDTNTSTTTPPTATSTEPISFNFLKGQKRPRRV